MNKVKVSSGAVHKIPEDLREVLIAKPQALNAWEDITVLARNEWICWVISAKKADTRKHRIDRTSSALAEGKRRPCCWAGCVHR